MTYYKLTSHLYNQVISPIKKIVIHLPNPRSDIIFGCLCVEYECHVFSLCPRGFSSVFSSFLPPPKYTPVGGLATMNCT